MAQITPVTGQVAEPAVEDSTAVKVVVVDQETTAVLADTLV